MTRVTFALGAIGVALSCAPPPRARAPLEEVPFVLSAARPDDAMGADGRVQRRSTRLHFGARGHHSASPLVHAVVGGADTNLIVDTGADSHTITSSLVERINRIVGRSDRVIVDHGGSVVKTGLLDGASIDIDGWGPIPTTPLDVVPDAFDWGPIGGLLSPQAITGGGAIVLDMLAGEMVLRSSEDALAEIDALALPYRFEAARCGRSYVAEATVDQEPIGLLIDTGADRTDVATSSRAGRALLPKSTRSRPGFGIGGALETRDGGVAPLEVGGYHADVDVLIVDQTYVRCGIEGVIGMDVLSRCVMVLGAAQAIVRCGS